MCRHADIRLPGVARGRRLLWVGRLALALTRYWVNWSGVLVIGILADCVCGTVFLFALLLCSEALRHWSLSHP